MPGRHRTARMGNGPFPFLCKQSVPPSDGITVCPLRDALYCMLMGRIDLTFPLSQTWYPHYNCILETEIRRQISPTRSKCHLSSPKNNILLKFKILFSRQEAVVSCSNNPLILLGNVVYSLLSFPLCWLLYPYSGMPYEGLHALAQGKDLMAFKQLNSG